MPTWTALTTLADEAAANALAGAMEALDPLPSGVGVFAVEDGSGLWEVGGYFTGKPDIAGLSLLTEVHGARAFAVSEIPDRDWVAEVRRELAPVHAGRFVVFGSHDEAAISRHKIGLKIDAAMAFGTGHHGTTRGCLLALDRLVRQGMVALRVADIGAGTAVLAMGAAKVWPCSVIASDIDPVATATAAVNVRANRLGERVRCVTAPGFRHASLREAAPFDLVFANILANPLKRLAGDMARHAAQGGFVILSGILNEQASGVEAVYRSHGFARETRRELGEWTTLTLCRS